MSREYQLLETFINESDIRQYQVDGEYINETIEPEIVASRPNHFLGGMPVS